MNRAIRFTVGSVECCGVPEHNRGVTVATEYGATLPVVPTPMLLLGGSWPDVPGLDTALSQIILDRVSTGELPATLRLYVPGREVAFGKRDTISPQYPAAVAAARGAGFEAVQRLAGGRAAVFTEHTIAFSIAFPDDDPRSSIHDRFRHVSEIIVDSLWRLGVSSSIGEVPGEYCPGEYSVNHEGRIKLMGIGQRLAKRAAHVGGVIAVNDTPLLLHALIPVYRALELEWRPATAGTIGSVQRGLSNADVLAALKNEFGEHYTLTRDRIDQDLVETARAIADDYVPDRDQPAD